jgi:DNA-binding transcriptional ArsR family regulator
LTTDSGPPEENGEEINRAIAEVMGDEILSKIFIAIADISRPELPGQGVSVRQVAERTGEPPRRVRYHLDTLVERGLVAVTGEARRRGVVERHFSAVQTPVLKSDEGVSDKQSRKVVVEIIKRLFSDVTAAVSSGTFTRRPEHAVLRMPGLVDQRGLEELAAANEEAMRCIEAALVRSGERLRDSGGPSIPVISALLLFEGERFPE